jgi:hypothetical protein
MSRLFTPLAAIGLVIIAASLPVCRAQAPEAGEASAGMTGLLRLGTMLPQTPITVLAAPAVQAELKLTDAQKTKASELALTAGQRYRESLQALLFSGDANPDEILSIRVGLRQENERAVVRILEAKQAERLYQIVLQAEGPLAVSRPDVAAKLRLGASQNERIHNIMLQLQQSQRTMYAAARRQVTTFNQLEPSRFDRVRDEMAKVRDAAVLQIGKVLDRKQKANFNKMLGEPFDVAKLDPEAKGDPRPAKDGAKGTARPARAKSRPKPSRS